MAAIKDGRQLTVKAVVKKKNLLSKDYSMIETECKITASVTAGIISIDIPDHKTTLCVRLQDIVAVISATNNAYREQKIKM